MRSGNTLRGLASVALALALTSCGNTVSTGGSETSDGIGEAGGNVVELDCGYFGVDDLINDYVLMGYSIAVVNVGQRGRPVAVGEDRGKSVFTPIAAAVVRKLAGGELPAELYIHGGTVEGHTTQAMGPAGMAPGRSALVFVHPSSGSDGAPGRLVENAVPIRGDRVFFGGDCWSTDGLPSAVPTQASVERLRDGSSIVARSVDGATVPLEDVVKLIGDAEEGKV